MSNIGPQMLYKILTARKKKMSPMGQVPQSPMIGLPQNHAPGQMPGPMMPLPSLYQKFGAK